MRFPHSASLQRKTLQGTQYIFAVLSDTQCFLQPLSDEQSQLQGITFGKAFRCYFPYITDIQEGDRATIDGDVYGVKGIRAHNYGNLKHKRATLELL